MQLPNVRSSSGFVYLVGAGPGDPKLLTVRALELLQMAEVIAYDDLVNPAILSLTHSNAELLPVGHRGSRQSRGKHSEWTIHPEVIERALAGKIVVRLKAGDPLVYGRGGEEAEALAAVGIPYEIIPGITAALGAASYAGIPLTHRGISGSFTVTTGDLATLSQSYREDDLDVLKNQGTLIIYMMRKSLEERLRNLITRGLSSTLPAAFVASATTPSQQVVVGTIGNLFELTKDTAPHSPAIVIIGEVVRLRERISWLPEKILSGRRILLARARPGSSEIASELRILGADVLEAPIIETVDLEHVPENWECLNNALNTYKDFDGMVFSCARGVESVLRYFGTAGIDVRRFAHCPLIAIGTAAKKSLLRSGLQPQVTIEGYCKEALNDFSLELQNRKLLLFTSDEGRPGLLGDLVAHGAEPHSIPVYRFSRRYPRLVAPPPELIVLPSSSSVRIVLDGNFGIPLISIPMVAMGERTLNAALQRGAKTVFQAEEDTVTSIVSKTVSLLVERNQFPKSDPLFTSSRSEPHEVRAF